MTGRSVINTTRWKVGETREVCLTPCLLVPSVGAVYYTLDGGTPELLEYPRQILEPGMTVHAVRQRAEGGVALFGKVAFPLDSQLLRLWKNSSRATLALSDLSSRREAVGRLGDVDVWADRFLGPRSTWKVQEISTNFRIGNFVNLFRRLVDARQRVGFPSNKLLVDLQDGATLRLVLCQMTGVVFCTAGPEPQTRISKSDRDGLVEKLEYDFGGHHPLFAATSRHLVWFREGDRFYTDLDRICVQLGSKDDHLSSRAATTLGVIVTPVREEDIADLQRLGENLDRQYGACRDLVDAIARRMFPEADPRPFAAIDIALFRLQDRREVEKRASMKLACLHGRFRKDVFEGSLREMEKLSAERLAATLMRIEVMADDSRDLPLELCAKEATRRQVAKRERRGQDEEFCYRLKLAGKHVVGKNRRCCRCGVEVGSRGKACFSRRGDSTLPDRLWTVGGKSLFRECQLRGYRTGVCPISDTQLASDLEWNVVRMNVR